MGMHFSVGEMALLYKDSRKDQTCKIHLLPCTRFQLNYQIILLIYVLDLDQIIFINTVPLSLSLPLPPLLAA